MRRGIYLPNRASDAYTRDELAALVDLAPDCLVILLYGGQVDQIHAAQIAPYLRAKNPLLLLRPYAGNIPQWNGLAWASECWARYQHVGLVGELIPANEMNLPVEGGSEDWEGHIRWYRDFLLRWGTHTRTVPVHLPALSPVGNYLQGWQAYWNNGLHHLFAAVDVHAYSVDHLADLLAHYPFAHHLTHLTEFNQLLPTGLLNFSDKQGFASASYFLLGGTADQARYDLLKLPSDYHAFKDWRSMPVYSSPNHDGFRPQTQGVVLHSTRGGTANLQAEYTATISWFDNPASQVSAHAIVGPKRQVHLPVDPTLIAWHCRARNRAWLGLEIVQPHRGDPLDADAVDEAARIVAGWHQNFGFPLQWSLDTGLCEHFETPEGIADGKSDIEPPFDRADFLRRVIAYATPPLNVAELRTFPTWANERLDHGQDFRGDAGLAAFRTHLGALGADATDPFRYGYPTKP